MKPQNAADPRVEYRAIKDLKRYHRNSRTHSADQVEKIAASMLEFGWTVPILIRGETDEIAAGHGRLDAAELLVDRGHDAFRVAPVIVRYGWTDEQFRAYVIADNKIAEEAGWDKEILRLELGDLSAAGFDVTSTGFTLEAIDALLSAGTQGHTDPDAAPPVPDEPVSKPGDVWILGGHRIICGDCTDPDVVDAVLDGSRPKLMVTDPPYGVDYDPSWRVKAGVGGGGTATGLVLNDHRADWREAWELFPGDVAYVWHGGLHAGTVADSLKSQGFEIRSQIIWHKTRFALSRGHYHWQHEPAWVAVRPGAEKELADAFERFVESEDFKPEGIEALREKIRAFSLAYEADHEVAAYAVREGANGGWQGDRKQSTVWTIEHIKSDTGHGTQKPIECMKRPIENNSIPGQTIYEPFSGSGTTLIACEMTGRRCRAIELNPAYVDVAVRRWQDFTHETAILESDGRTFEEVAAARLFDGEGQ